MSVWLAITDGPREGEQFEVGADGATIGRDEEADLVVSDVGVSRRHARVALDERGYVAITDLGSANGTFVNAEPVEGARRLVDGDRITVGGTTLELRGGSEAATDALGGAVATERVEPPTAPTDVAPAQPPAAPPPPPRRPTPRVAAAPPPRRPPPQREAPAPAQAPAPAAGAGNRFNLPAVGALVCGPLSILLAVLGAGTAFYAALPVGVLGIALGSAGKRQVDSGRSSSLRSFALAGQIFAVVGVVLSTLLIALLVIFNEIVDAGADSLEGLIDEVRSEIEGVPVPEELQR